LHFCPLKITKIIAKNNKKARKNAKIFMKKKQKNA